MRVRWVRTALVAACALAYLVVWAGTAEAATPRQLLHRYQPVTVLDPLEQFAPTEVNGFVDDSVLEIQTAPGVWTHGTGESDRWRRCRCSRHRAASTPAWPTATA